MNILTRSWIDLSAAALAAALSLTTATAAAADPAAAKAYREGTAAEARRDHAKAARLFAQADKLAPNPTALKAALDAAVLADDAVLGMELVLRADERGADEAVAPAAEAAREKFKDQVGRLQIACAGCTAKVDRESFAVNHARLVRAGFHLVAFEVSGDTETRLVQVKASQTTRVSPKASPAPPAVEAAPAPAPAPEASAEKTETKPAEKPPQGPSDGISSGWFWTGVGLVAAGSVATVASGVDTLKKHDAYVLSPSEEGLRAGRTADARTQIFLGSTIALAVGTAAIGIFAVRWGDQKPKVTGSVGVGPGAAAVSLGGRF